MFLEPFFVGDELLQQIRNTGIVFERVQICFHAGQRAFAGGSGHEDAGLEVGGHGRCGERNQLAQNLRAGHSQFHNGERNRDRDAEGLLYGRVSFRIDRRALGALDDGIVSGGVFPNRGLEPVSELDQEVTLRAERDDFVGVTGLLITVIAGGGGAAALLAAFWRPPDKTTQNEKAA